MAADDLGIKERAALLALMAEARELSNQELEEIVGFRLQGEARRKLADRKLVESHKDAARRGMLVHVLTDDGWAWCDEEFAAGRPPVRGPGSSAANALSVVLRGLGQYLARTNQKPADLFGPATATASEAVSPAGGIEDRIWSAYRRLAKARGDFVPLARLRPLLGDAGRSEVDEALVRMTLDRRANLASQANQKNLDPADHAAAVRIGGDDNHLISIEEEP